MFIVFIIGVKMRIAHLNKQDKKMLKSCNSRRTLNCKDENEYPGFFESDKHYHCNDYKAKPFATKSRAHYMYDDN